MRIQGRETSYITKYPKGIFSLCWNLIRDDQFKNHEPVITFFKCESTLEMIEKLKPATALLDRHQKPYDVVYTNFVGTIVYEDDWQVAVQVENGKMI